MGRRNTTITHIILFCLAMTIISPKVIAESKWEEDGWLNTVLAQDRLANGDEFGCYEIPGLSWKNDPGAVALECRNYIEDRVIASQWGDNPISTYVPEGLTMAQHEIIAQQGFVIHGDETGLQDSAWHDQEDTPNDLWDWYNLGRRGGSLEQVAGSVSELKTAVESGGLVNMYWIGRVNEANIRHDSAIEDYISDDADAWLTTWGESWSYWAKSRCYEFSRDVEQIDGTYVLTFQSLITQQCLSLQSERWNVPATWIIDIGESEIISIVADGINMSNIQGERHTTEGFSHNNSQYLHLSVRDGVEVKITMESSQYDIVGLAEFWNNHSAAITIAAHETSDLFKWSKRFVDSEDLVFTWLIQPRDLDEKLDWIPYVAIAVGLGAITSMLLILRKEGLGPLANKNNTNN